jgi:allantoin racemase
VKIWYQSSTSLGLDPMWSPYLESLRKHVQEVAREGTVVDVHGVQVTHPLVERSQYVKYLNQGQIIDNAIAAEKEAYDAFCVGCTLDPGFLEVREVIGIPVAFLSESCFHLATMLADKFSLISYNAAIVQALEQKIDQYGLKDHFVSCSFFDLSMQELIHGFDDPDSIIESVQQVGREAVAKGAGVLLTACNILNMVLVKWGVKEIDGVPIMDTAGALVKVGEFMVDLKQAGISRSKPFLSREDVVDIRKTYLVEE